MVIHTHFLHKSYDYVKHFVRVSVLFFIMLNILSVYRFYMCIGDKYRVCQKISKKFPVQSILNAI